MLGSGGVLEGGDEAMRVVDGVFLGLRMDRWMDGWMTVGFCCWEASFAGGRMTGRCVRRDGTGGWGSNRCRSQGVLRGGLFNGEEGRSRTDDGCDARHF
jgi:hypothetical protein